MCGIMYAVRSIPCSSRCLHVRYQLLETDTVCIDICGNTQNVPIPQVYAYGRRRLRRDISALQVFILFNYIDEQPLTKKKSFGIIQKTAGLSFSGKLLICLPNYEAWNSLEEAR